MCLVQKQMQVYRNILNTKLLHLKCVLKLSPFYAVLHTLPLNMTTENKVCSSSNSILMPPPNVFGMKNLDRDLFKKEIEVPSLNIPVEKLKACLKVLKPCLLKMSNLPPVQGDDNEKKVLLNPVLFDEKLPYLEEMLKKLSLNNVYWTKLMLSYDNFTPDSIFKSVLPPDTAGNVSGFSIVGHIIHLNLKPDLMEYKYLIGNVLLDKFHNIKTVVNKAQVIETEFRNFQMELLAGEPNYEVIVKENGFQYAFDFSKVFWNPRLVHEHGEIVKKFQSRDIVFDIFAGVGPFAVPSAKKNCTVYANDLNPFSYEWLCHNAQLNKVSDSLKAYNLDGREFIRTVVKEKIAEHWTESEKHPIHIIMNLPACALEFVNAFQGLLVDHKFPNAHMPVVYCYFFLRKDEDATQVIQKYFDEECSKNIDVAPVRVVAPNKRMMRLTYKIPSSTLFNTENSCIEPSAKKIKLSL